MGVYTTETRHLECDRCGTKAEFPTDVAAVKAGWDFVSINQHRKFVLCPIDATKHQRFLDGLKTGAGHNFNADEDIRWKRSCLGKEAV